MLRLLVLRFQLPWSFLNWKDWVAKFSNSTISFIFVVVQCKDLEEFGGKDTPAILPDRMI